MPPLSAEQALDWLRSNHIAPDPDADPRDQEDAALARNARIMAGAFSGMQGEAALQLILDASLFRPPVDHRLEGEPYLRFAQMREGQNQLAAAILAYLDHARSLKGQPDERQRGPGGPDPEPGGRPRREPEPDAGGGPGDAADLVAVR